MRFVSNNNAWHIISRHPIHNNDCLPNPICCTVYYQLLLSGKSFSDDKNKAETLLQDFSLFCYFACWKKTLVT